MPAVSQTAQIEVRAPAQAAFAVVERDILAVDDDPDRMTGHRPLVAGPLREGFRWQQTLVHERRVCRTDWLVAELRPPFVLEQTMEHLCTVSRREVLGGERWELEECSDGTTLVTLRAWHLIPGLRGWMRRLVGHPGFGISLKKRLAYVQFEAERG